MEFMQFHLKYAEFSENVEIYVKSVIPALFALSGAPLANPTKT